VEQCSDKFLTWNTFASDAIPMLQCDAVATEAANRQYRDQSLIFKPRFGAGCGEIQRGNLPLKSDPSSYIQQLWVDGESLSVGVLSGCNGFCILPVARQDVIWQNDHPVYRGGTIPANLGNDIAEQITAIAEQVMQQIGSFSGYLGLDFLVAETDNAVFLNEINSRLSTSYIGYRQLLETNPLELLLGRTSDVTRSDDSQPISFDVRTAFHAD
jgi:predicted ATP-grasp superfamily ATP-dependent carboligase